MVVIVSILKCSAKDYSQSRLGSSIVSVTEDTKVLLHKNAPAEF